MSQLLEPGDEALAGLTVDAARLHHGLALLHELGDNHFTRSIKTLIEIFVAREQKPGQTQREYFSLKLSCDGVTWSHGAQELSLF